MIAELVIFAGVFGAVLLGWGIGYLHGRASASLERIAEDCREISERMEELQS